VKLETHLLVFAVSLLLAAPVRASVVPATPASVDTLQLSDWWSTNGGGAATIDFSGTNLNGQPVSGPHETGGAGGLLAYNLTTGGAGFQAWCIDIFHSFSFPATSAASLVAGGAAGSLINATKAYDLGLLYTAHRADVEGRSSGTTNTAAFQLAVWEIVNESGTAYNLGTGAFRATGTGADQAALWLSELRSIAANQYRVDVWQIHRDVPLTGPTGSGLQDVAVFAPVAAVPLPGGAGLLAGGLCLLGLAARRRMGQRNQETPQL
jgi:hypothetical protein